MAGRAGRELGAAAGVSVQLLQHHHPVARKINEEVPTSGCQSIPPPQNAPAGLCGAGFTLRIWAAVVNEASFGSSMCLLGMAIPLLPPTAQGIAGMSGMPPQSRSWPASAPSWNSTMVFNYSLAARFVNWAPSAFPPLDSRDSPWCHCTSVNVDRDQQVGMALVHSFVPGAGSSISWRRSSAPRRRSTMPGGPP